MNKANINRTKRLTSFNCLNHLSPFHLHFNPVSHRISSITLKDIWARGIVFQAKYSVLSTEDLLGQFINLLNCIIIKLFNSS